jgi:hypothetical protein
MHQNGMKFCMAQPCPAEFLMSKSFAQGLLNNSTEGPPNFQSLSAVFETADVHSLCMPRCNGIDMLPNSTDVAIS